MAPKGKNTSQNLNKKEFKVKSNKKSSSYLEDDENFKPFKTQLSKIGLQLRDITGDGNCCFRALSDQMEGNESQHLDYRKRVCQYMKQYRDDFEPFIAALIDDDEENGDDKKNSKKANKRLDNFENYIKNLEVPGTYADNGCLVAFARLYQLDINIHQLDLPIWTINGAVKVAKKHQQARQLHLAYHNGEHYSSIRRSGDTTHTPTDINFDNDYSNTIRQGPGHKSKANASYDYDENYESTSELTELNVDQIINITNCHDIDLINEKLKLNNNDLESTIDMILAEVGNLQIADSKSKNKKANKVTKADKKKEKKDRQMERHRQNFLEKNQDTSNQANNARASNVSDNEMNDNFLIQSEIKSI